MIGLEFIDVSSVTVLNDTVCLKVELKLGKLKAEVGEKIPLSIRSDEGSLCALSAIDKSVTFLGKKQNSLDLEKVLNLPGFSALNSIFRSLNPFFKVFAAIDKLSAQQYIYNSYPRLNDCLGMIAKSSASSSTDSKL